MCDRIAQPAVNGGPESLRGKPRDRGLAMCDRIAQPAVNGGPEPLRGKPRERG